MLTRALLFAIALLLAAGLWRLARWHWRPRLVLPDEPLLDRTPGETRVYLDVRNEGAGRSRGCRAVLIRCERRDNVGWLRCDPPRRRELEDPRRAPQGIDPGGSSRIELDCALPVEPGEYRVQIAVLNGEEKRASYVIRV